MRRSGILLPISSLPTTQGRGSLGREAYRFVDFLSFAGQSLWQINSLDTQSKTLGRTHSVFAGRVDWIDLALLCEEGLLSAEETESAHKMGQEFSKKGHLSALSKAVARQNKLAADYVHFREENKIWLEPYALFMAIREAQGGRALADWPEALRRRNSYALKAAQTRLASRTEFWCCVQFFYFKQWCSLKKYAGTKGIQLVDELSFYAPADSVDAWVQPELFQMGSEKTGPLAYDWPQHKKSRFDWWLRRFAFAAQHSDMVRMQQFCLFASEGTQKNKDNEIVASKPGPGNDFVRSLHRALPELKLITEDGTSLDEEASALLAYSGYPGAKNLQQAFSAQRDKDSLPHHHTQHSVLYTSLLSRNSLACWQETATQADLAYARKYLALQEHDSVRLALIRCAQASVADTVIIPLWDFSPPQNHGNENTPYRISKDVLNHWLCAEIREITALYERTAPPEKTQKQRGRRGKTFRFQKGGKEHG